MWKSGDLHCKCQQHLTLLFLMHKLLASIIEKWRPFHSTGRTAAISQDLPSACLKSKHIELLTHSRTAERRGYFSNIPHQPSFSQIRQVYMPLLPPKRTWIACPRVRELCSSVVLCKPWSVPTSPCGHPASSPPATTCELQFLGIHWLGDVDRQPWSMPFPLQTVTVPMIMECHVPVSFVGGAG